MGLVDGLVINVWRLRLERNDEVGLIREPSDLPDKPRVHVDVNCSAPT